MRIRNRIALLLIATAVPTHALDAPSVLRVAADSNYPPYFFLGVDQQPRGYLVDEWRLWELRTGIPVRLIPTDRDDAEKMVLTDEADVVDLMFATPERKVLYDFTDSYADITVGVYVDATISGIDGVGALRGFLVGTERGDACVNRLREDGIPQTRLFSNYAEMMNSAAQKDVRIFCMDDFPANYYLYQESDRVRFRKAFDYYTDQLRRGVKKGNKATAELVDKGMALITQEERDTLKGHWMGQPVSFTPYARYFGWGLVALTVSGLLLGLWVALLKRAVNRRAQAVAFLTYHDALTQLPNRYLLVDRIDAAIQKGELALTVFLIDLDNFKLINESFAHEVGDKLLKDIVDRLKAAFSPAYTLARIGSNAFAILAHDLVDAADMTRVAERIRHVVLAPFAWKGKSLFVNASIGISHYPEDGKDASTLFKHADTALGLAKREGRDTFRFYRASLTKIAREIFDLSEGLRYAMERHELHLVYQPQACMRTGEIVGVEALLRWDSPSGAISPERFIPFAEEAGLIQPIGSWVLQSACRQLALWLEEGLPRIRLAVNLSPRQFSEPDLAQQVDEALKSSRIPPELLELEITEGCLLSQDQKSAHTVSRLRSLGVRLAIDDFGTGYSSMAYLHRYPLELLKIDKSFLKGLPQEKSAAALTSAVIAMARALKIKVLAEGVETIEQWRYLEEQGCDYAQGWLISAAMKPDEFRVWLLHRVTTAP